jgi:hypothetical protein
MGLIMAAFRRPFGTLLKNVWPGALGLTPLAMDCRPSGTVVQKVRSFAQGLTPLAMNYRPFGTF